MTIVYRTKKSDVIRLKEIARSMSHNTGMTYAEAYAAATAFCDAVRASLSEGLPVRVEKFGTWEFRYRKARTTKWSRGMMAGEVRSQPDKWVVRFAPSPNLKAIANHTAPPQKPQYGSNTILTAVKPIAELVKNPNAIVANLIPGGPRHRPNTPARKAPGKA